MAKRSKLKDADGFYKMPKKPGANATLTQLRRFIEKCDTLMAKNREIAKQRKELITLREKVKNMTPEKFRKGIK